MTVVKDQKENTNALTFAWNKQRTLRQATIAGFLLSPGLHLFLTRVMVNVALPGYSQTANIVFRVAVHQACMMPYM